MEHRWGVRSRLDIPVHIDCGSGTMVFGVLRDASVSGAFVCTAAQLPAMTIVGLVPLTDRCRNHDPIEAYVVRWTPEGCALEWCDLAPAAIVELMYLAEAPLASIAAGAGREMGETPIAQPETRIVRKIGGRETFGS